MTHRRQWRHEYASVTNFGPKDHAGVDCAESNGGQIGMRIVLWFSVSEVRLWNREESVEHRVRSLKQLVLRTLSTTPTKPAVDLDVPRQTACRKCCCQRNDQHHVQHRLLSDGSLLAAAARRFETPRDHGRTNGRQCRCS